MYVPASASFRPDSGGLRLLQNARDIMADCQAQLQDPEIAEVEAALIEEHQVCVRKRVVYAPYVHGRADPVLHRINGVCST